MNSLLRRRFALLSLGSFLFPGIPSAGTEQFAGVNDHMLSPSMYLRRELDMRHAARLGAKAIRADLRWEQLEPAAEGHYDRTYLSRIDSVVSLARSFGIKPLFAVLGTPCWASSAPTDVKRGCGTGGSWSAYPPTSPSYYANTMAFLARRYGRNVAGWQIWNEPNLSYFWNAHDRAADYVALVGSAYAAVKRVSAVPVIAGAVSRSDTHFVGQLYDDGIEGKFDVFSIHPYSFNDSPLTPADSSYYGTAESSFIDGVQAVHKLMVKHGDERPIWLTEFGWDTSKSGVGPATQAQYVSQAYAQIQSWPYVQGGFYYELQDQGTDRANNQQNEGLYYYDGHPKPGAAAFRSASAGLAMERQAARVLRRFFVALAHAAASPVLALTRSLFAVGRRRHAGQHRAP